MKRLCEIGNDLQGFEKLFSEQNVIIVSGIHPDQFFTLGKSTFLGNSGSGINNGTHRIGNQIARKHFLFKLLLPFVPHLISIDEESLMRIFDVKSEKMLSHFEFDKKIFDISAICHPMTYKDKVLLGSKQGTLQLWNLKSAKKIYKFKGELFLTIPFETMKNLNDV